MPTYKLKLEVEVVCPTREGEPEMTITAREVKESLLATSSPGTNGYAVCSMSNVRKLTASLHINKVELEPLTCEHCGNKVEVP